MLINEWNHTELPDGFYRASAWETDEGRFYLSITPNRGGMIEGTFDTKSEALGAMQKFIDGESNIAGLHFYSC